MQVHRPPHPPSGRPADRHRPRQATPTTRHAGFPPIVHQRLRVYSRGTRGCCPPIHRYEHTTLPLIRLATGPVAHRLSPQATRHPRASRPIPPYADHRPHRLGTFALHRRHSSPMPPYPDHLHPTDSHSTRVSCSSQADATVRGGTSIDTALHRIARLSPGADGPKPARHQTTTPPRSGHPARSHRTRTTSTPPTRTRPESRTSPGRMASHAEVRPLTRLSTASLDSHPAPTSRSPPHTRLLPLHALATGRPAPHPHPHPIRRLRVCPPAQGAAVPLSTERHTTRPLIQLESGQGHRADTPPHSPRRVGRLATARRPPPLAPTVTDRAQGS